MPFVLDASVAASWHFDDERSREAEVVLDLLSADRGLVPLHWWFEISNILLMGERRGRASDGDTSMFLDRLAKLPFDVAERAEGNAVLTLARKHELTFYDAVYLELARRERVPLATLDKALAAAAAAERVKLIVSK